MPWVVYFKEGEMMIKMKTAELKGAALDWAVAHCEGRKPSYYKGIVRATAYPDSPDSPPMFGPELNYSTDWAQGGPIIERERIGIWSSEANGHDGEWCARTINTYITYSPTPLIAAMRCCVTSKLGDEVDVPVELL